jgi:hypothetical protein
LHEFIIICDCFSDNLLVLLTIKNFWNILFICFFIFIGFACKKKTESPPDVGYAYAPTTIGKYVIYDVDSTVYDDFKMDTTYSKYRIKEKLEEIYVDNQGRKAIKLIRYIKKYNPLVTYDNIPWTVKDVWNYTKTNTTLEVVEEDVRVTKLAFPINMDAAWNGNANNTMGDWEYKYDYFDNKEAINGTTFDNVLMVVQKDDKSKNAIHREYFIEKYAKNVGLVYREIKDLYSNVVTLNPNGTIKPVEQRIQKGVIYKLTYVTHGSE